MRPSCHSMLDPLVPSTNSLIEDYGFILITGITSSVTFWSFSMPIRIACKPRSKFWPPSWEELPRIFALAGDVCGSLYVNPCWVGTCRNGGDGSYTCICPPGYYSGTKSDGTNTCAPTSDLREYQPPGLWIVSDGEKELSSIYIPCWRVFFEDASYLSRDFLRCEYQLLIFCQKWGPVFLVMKMEVPLSNGTISLTAPSCLCQCIIGAFRFFSCSWMHRHHINRTSWPYVPSMMCYVASSFTWHITNSTLLVVSADAQVRIPVSVNCLDVYPVFGLTAAQFQQATPGVGFLPLSSVLHNCILKFPLLLFFYLQLFASIKYVSAVSFFNVTHNDRWIATSPFLPTKQYLLWTRRISIARCFTPQKR